MKKYCLEGYEAFNSGIKRDANPRDIKGNPNSGPQEAIDWWKGWDLACYDIGLLNQPNVK